MSVNPSTNNAMIREKSGKVYLDPNGLKENNKSLNQGSLKTRSSDGSLRSISISSCSSNTSKKIVDLGIKVASIWDIFVTKITFGYCNRATKVSFDGGHNFKWLESKSLSKYFFKVLDTTHLLSKEDKKYIGALKTHCTASKGPYDLNKSALEGFTRAAKKENPTLVDYANTPVCIGNFLKTFVVNIESTNRKAGTLPNMFVPIKELEATIFSLMDKKAESVGDLDKNSRKKNLLCSAENVTQTWSNFFVQFKDVQETKNSSRSSTISVSSKPASISSFESQRSIIPVITSTATDLAAEIAGSLGYRALMAAHKTHAYLTSKYPGWI